MFTSKAWLLVGLCLLGSSASATNLSLDDLFSEKGAADVAVSPSGRYVSAVVRRQEDDLLVLMDLETGKTQTLTRVGRKDVGKLYDSRIVTVQWKTDDIILFRASVYPAEGMSWRSLAAMGSNKFGHRLFSIDRTGKRLVRMLATNRESALDWALDLGQIRSLMPKDPAHILMVVDGEDGRSLFKVDVNTGAGEIVEKARPEVWDWWLDLDGRPIVQVQVSAGSVRFYRREDERRWKKFYSVRLRELKELTEYEPIGPSDQPMKFYVLARPEGAQRRGIYLYDIQNESFGPPIVENDKYDIFAATASRDGKGIRRYCYIAHVRICEFADAKANGHMKGVRKYFNDSANVYIADASDDGETLLLLVEGPSDPPAYYQYRFATKQIQVLGLVREAEGLKNMPAATVVEYAARDGLPINGYLTRPPGADATSPLPLVVFPHGGPESRDYLSFDLYAQYLAARGYAVFQPNFRGSEGFGLAFIEKGYGEWGRKMQDDVTDGVRYLVDRKFVDPTRVCIVGASYGGYAALAGVAFTPDLYRCAVSIAGVSDLRQFLKSRLKKFGPDSEVYSYWKKQIGDPETDAARIDAVSPAQHVQEIKVPVLLIHGDSDQIVPYAQSEDLKKILDKSGRKTELITLEDEDHSDWSDDDERAALEAVGNFVEKHLGPGFSKP